MALGLDGMNLITIIQSILLIISALIIIIAAIGILKMDKDMPNVVYARIHILGMIDVAGIIAFLGLGQPLFALIYLFLAPLLAHALANAYFHAEDDLNNPVLNPNLLNEESGESELEESVDVAEHDGEEAEESVDVAGQDGEDSDSEETSENVEEDSNSEEASKEDSEEETPKEDVDNKTTEEDVENLNNSEGDDND